MPHAENTVTVQRPVDEVFAFLADGRNERQWRPAVLDIEHESGVGVGARYRQGMKGPFGRRVPADYEVTAFEPGRRIAFRGVAGPVRPQGSFELADEAGATRLTFRLDADLHGPARLMSPVVARSMRSEVEALDNLRRVLEWPGS